MNNLYDLWFYPFPWKFQHWTDFRECQKRGRIFQKIKKLVLFQIQENGGKNSCCTLWRHLHVLFYVCVLLWSVLMLRERRQHTFKTGSLFRHFWLLHFYPHRQEAKPPKPWLYQKALHLFFQYKTLLPRCNLLSLFSSFMVHKGFRFLQLLFVMPNGIME